MVVALAGCALAGGGCGGSGANSGGGSAASPSAPAYVTQPFTGQQRLVQQGARLIVAKGCSACHLVAANAHIAPSFTSLAGHRVALADGRTVLVDQHLIAQALRRPAAVAMKGYYPTAMVRAVARAHLTAADIAALAAFIEQIGPE